MYNRFHARTKRWNSQLPTRRLPFLFGLLKFIAYSIIRNGVVESGCACSTLKQQVLFFFRDFQFTFHFEWCKIVFALNRTVSLSLFLRELELGAKCIIQMEDQKTTIFNTKVSLCFSWRISVKYVCFVWRVNFCILSYDTNFEPSFILSFPCLKVVQFKFWAAYIKRNSPLTFCKYSSVLWRKISLVLEIQWNGFGMELFCCGWVWVYSRLFLDLFCFTSRV